MPVTGHNYDQPFEVIGDPYDYGLEDSEYTTLGGAAPPAVLDLAAAD